MRLARPHRTAPSRTDRHEAPPFRVARPVPYAARGLRRAGEGASRTTGGVLMRRLGGVDAAFLYAETPAWHMHVSALLIVDPSARGGRFDFDALRAVTVGRLPDLPQFRGRAVEVPFGLDRPVWI